MKRFIFPGSFDPFTLGHLDIAKRALNLCDELVIAVMFNSSKTTMFNVEERIEIATKSLHGLSKVSVISFEGLLVDLYQSWGATSVVRGLRSENDFRIESEMMAANKVLYPNFEGIFLVCNHTLSFTSSTLVREIATYRGDISQMVAQDVKEIILNKAQQRKKVKEVSNHAR